MALCNFSSPKFPNLKTFPSSSLKKFPTSSFSVRSEKSTNDGDNDEEATKPKKLSQQSSWEAKDSEGKDYLYRLGKEADNMNIAVGARAGVIDDLFAGNFLGRDGNFIYFLFSL